MQKSISANEDLVHKILLQKSNSVRLDKFKKYRQNLRTKGMLTQKQDSRTQFENSVSIGCKFKETRC